VKLTIVAVGKLKERHWRDAAAEYLTRLRPYADVRVVEIADRPLDDEPRAVRAEAETQAALGDLRGAIDRLRAGQRLAGDGGSADFVERSAIDARLRELQLEQRAREAEARRGG